jgi:hypothetical protein
MPTSKTLFLAVFILTGFAYSCTGLWSGFAAYQSTSWPYLQGQILEAGCREAAEETRARYVKYVYSVDAKQYMNNREAFGGTISSPDCYVDYRTGQSVRVFYNPANPSDSVLEPGNYRPSLFKILLGAVFTGVGLLLYFTGRKEELPLPPTPKNVVSNFKINDDTVVKNKIVHQIPVLDNEHIVYDFPLSVVIAGKLGFGLGGIGFIVMALGDTNSHLDLWKKVVICLFGAACILLAVHPKAWYSRFFFLADKRGLFFPCSDGSPNSKEQKQHHWLFVPWKNIVNMRLAQIDDSHGIAFDAKVSPEEKESFFGNAVHPVDRKELYVHGVLRVVYSSHPHPSIGSLLKLMKQATR